MRKSAQTQSELKVLGCRLTSHLAIRASRAFGADIGNLVHGKRENKNPGKEKAATEKNAARDVTSILNAVREKARRTASEFHGSFQGTRNRSQSLKPKEENAPEGNREGKKASGGLKTMSSMLYKNSEQATCLKTEKKVLPDIDAADHNNPLAVTQYINDIYAYYHRVEPRYRPRADYMSRQKDVNDKMRAILIDWLVEVHLKFKLMPETLFLTVNLIDRFLEEEQVTRKNLQLVGVTAMLIASKYEEIWAPEVRDFVYISDKAYNRDQILGMEKLMLNTLNFHLTVPTQYTFLVRYCKAAGCDKQAQMLAQFLVELTLPMMEGLKYSDSKIACAAVYTAQKCLNKPAFTYELEMHSGYKEEDIMPCALVLANLHRKAATASLVAVHKKYSNPKFHEVANISPCQDLLHEE